MSNPDLVSMAQAFSGLPLRDLIGIPLIEACHANSRMALTQTKYILDTGFEQSTASDGSITYKPIEINFSLTRPIVTSTSTTDSTTNEVTTVQDVSSTTTDIALPLISAMQLSLIGVDFVRVAFDMEVKSSFSRETTEAEETELTTSASLEAKFGFGGFSAKIKGSVSYHSEKSFEEKEKFSKSNSARYNIEITASQQPMPQGLAVLLEAFANNVGPHEVATV